VVRIARLEIEKVEKKVVAAVEALKVLRC